MGTNRSKKAIRRYQRKKAKYQQNRIRTFKPKLFKLFIDDSGNTGLNIFDTQQPTYYSLGIITPKNFEMCDECASARKELKVAELHGNELGLLKINNIADHLIAAIKNHNLLFLCAEINKLYFGGMKFFDVIFDNGTNPGVGALHCWNKPLKYLLMISFIDLINEEELKCFWRAYEVNDITAFMKLMREMRTRVADYKTDARTKTLINDAFQGAENTPKEVLGCGRVKEDSPNVTGLGMFIHELHKILDGKRAIINEVIYDAQDEFGRSFKELYQILHQVKLIWTLTDHDAKRTGVFSPHFSIRDSKSCDALQLTDVFLFIHKKSRNVRLHSKVKNLHDAILERMHPLYMTKEALWDETEQMLAKVYSKPITTVDMIKGMRFLDELELKRVDRLRGGDNIPKKELPS
jgi:hypothetical protein